MRKIIAGLLCMCLMVSMVACAGQATPTEGDAKTIATAWITEAIKNNRLMSFAYDGKAYADHIGKWDKTVKQDGNSWTVTYVRDGVTVWSEIAFDEELAAFEWVNYFRNDGGEKSKIIAEICAMDTQVTVPDAVLTSANGATSQTTDFQAYSIDLTEQNEVEITAGGGRPSRDNLPYFDLSNGELGVIGGIGWTGSWKMNFINRNGEIRLCAGMRETNMALLANEQIRTPMIALQFFKGDQDVGHNAWRQLVLKSYTPIDTETGKPLTALPITMNTWGGVGSDVLVDKVNAGVDYDLFWVDAGWYGDTVSSIDTDEAWRVERGNWYPIKSVFPNGFADLDAATEAAGKKFMLWMEFETAAKDSHIAQEHPEFMLPDKDTHSNHMIDLSNPDCYDYMIEMVSGVMIGAGVEWWRMDFGNTADEKWTLKDKQLGEDRVGITEIMYVTNLYRFMDEMTERIPGLMIDICASGGHRLDLEMVRRGCSLWRTDYSAGNNAASSTADGTRSIGANLSWWLPLSAGGYGAEGRNSNYTFRSQFTAGMQAMSGVTDRGWYNTMMEQQEQMQQMMVGDYYMLAYGKDDQHNRVNAVYEFYLPQEGRGYLLAFRPALSDQADGCYILKGLDESATYQLEVVDTGETFTLSGRELMTTGLGIKFPVASLSHLIFFHKI